MRRFVVLPLLLTCTHCSDPSDPKIQGVDATAEAASPDASGWPDAGNDATPDAPGFTIDDDGTPPPWRWDEMVARVIDSQTLSVELAAKPPAGTEIYAALVEKNALGLAYGNFDYGAGAFAQAFWPASTVKLLTSLAALDYIQTQGFSGAATAQWQSGFGDVVNAIVDRAIRVSSNEDYDRTIRIAGFDQLNETFLSPERGFATTVIKASYAGFEIKNPPGYTLTEGANSKDIPARTAQGNYPCASGGNNCTNLFELTEAVRRVVLRDELPEPERFALAGADLDNLENALCKATPSFFASGVSAALGPGAAICHKPGWVPGSDSLDHGVITAADGRRFLLAAAVPDPGDSSSQKQLAPVAENVLAVLTTLKTPPFFLQPTAGAELRVKLEPSGLRLQCLGADAMQLWFDGASVSVTAQGDTFFAAATPSDWQGKLVTVRASAGGALIAVRNLVLA